MADKDEVKIELVADDKATGVLERLKKAFEHLNKEHEKSPFSEKEHGEGFSWKEAFKIEAVHEGIEKVKESLSELAEAGAAQDKTARALTGVLAMTDKTGQSYDSLLQKGKLFEESLSETAITAGVAKESLVSAFTMIMERSGKSAAETEHLVDLMAHAGEAIPGGLERISQGFAMMQAGMVHARNPIIQMIAATGVLQGGIKSVAHQMEKMTAEQRNKVAIEALTTMSEKMEKATPSFESLTRSLHNFKEGMIEDVGSGLLKTLMPELNELLGVLMSNKDKITRNAKEFGHWLADEFDIIWDGMRTAFNDAEMDASTIKDFLDEAGKDMATAVKWEIEGLGKAAQLISNAAAGAAYLYHKGADAANWFSGGAIGSGHSMQDFEAQKTLQAALSSGAAQRIRYGYSTGESEIEGLKKQSLEANEYLSTEEGKKAFLAQGTAESKDQFAKAQTYGFIDRPGHIFHKAEIEAGSEDAVEAFSQSMQHSQQDHQEAMEKYGALIIVDNEKFAEKLVEAGDKTGIAWDHVIDNLKDLEGKIPDVTKEKIEALQKLLKAGPGTAGTGPIFNINHMTVNQDFRDQDPERVAIVMQRDLARAAINRTQAHLSSAYNP